MDEYINREAFKQKLIDKGFFPAIVQRALEEMPSEDVAPKSEVAREIFEEIEQIIDTYSDEYGTMLTLEADEFAELKKKYLK